MTSAPRHPIDQGLQRRLRGCLLGGAVGDALGAPVEFLELAAIRQKFGSTGIRDLAPAYGRTGAITDDTQMTLFTAEGLLRAWVRANERGIGPAWSSVTAHAYLRWLVTQGERPKLLDGEELDGWLIEQRELHSRRGPGTTCLTALRAMKSFGDFAANDSKGCGGVMRVAPVGMFFARWERPGGDNIAEAFEVAAELARITHGHPSGYLSAGALAAMLALLLGGRPLEHAIDSALDLLRRRDGHEETFAAIDHARRLATSGAAPDAAIRQLGGGWVGEEALAIAVYCALVARNLEEAIILAVNHDGDSDSTGAITGNLLGARDGIESVPTRWLELLELHRVIEQVADDLATFPDWSIGAYTGTENEFYGKRYPGG